MTELALAIFRSLDNALAGEIRREMTAAAQGAAR